MLIFLGVMAFLLALFITLKLRLSVFILKALNISSEYVPFIPFITIIMVFLVIFLSSWFIIGSISTVARLATNPREPIVKELKPTQPSIQITPISTPVPRDTSTPFQLPTPIHTNTPAPRPQIFGAINRGQICRNKCIDQGSRVDICIWSNFPTNATANIYYSNGGRFGNNNLMQEYLNSNKQCLNNTPLNLDIGSYIFSVISDDGPSVDINFCVDDC